MADAPMYLDMFGSRVCVRIWQLRRVRNVSGLSFLGGKRISKGYCFPRERDVF